MDLDKILQLRKTHDKEHRKLGAEYNVPPAFCPKCSGKVEKQDPKFKETKAKVIDAIKTGKPILI